MRNKITNDEKKVIKRIISSIKQLYHKGRSIELNDWAFSNYLNNNARVKQIVSYAYHWINISSNEKNAISLTIMVKNSHTNVMILLGERRKNKEQQIVMNANEAYDRAMGIL